MIKISWAQSLRRLKKKSLSLPHLYRDGWLFTPALEPELVAESSVALPVGTDTIAPMQPTDAEWFLMSDVTWEFLVQTSIQEGADRVRVLFEDEPDEEDIQVLDACGYRRVDDYFDQYESADVASARRWKERQLWDVAVWRSETPLVEMYENWGTFLVSGDLPIAAMHEELVTMLRRKHGLDVGRR